jgi:Immunoglobulin-like domain of bacterial spore germination/Sporulation and spore germination
VLSVSGVVVPTGVSGAMAQFSGSVFGLSRAGKVTLSSVHPAAAPTQAAAAAAAVNMLLALPAASDRPFGVWSAVPAGVRLRGVRLSGATLAVDLSANFAQGTPWRLRQRTAQVVYTATSVVGISRVAFSINGVRVSRIGTGGPLVAAPVARSAFDSVTPAALVLNLRPGSHVTSPFVVRGVATSFEAYVHWKVVDLQGRLIARGVTQADNNVRGHFSATIRVPRPGSVHVIVGGDAPKGDVEMSDPAVTPLVLQ